MSKRTERQEQVMRIWKEICVLPVGPQHFATLAAAVIVAEALEGRPRIEEKEADERTLTQVLQDAGLMAKHPRTPSDGTDRVANAKKDCTV